MLVMPFITQKSGGCPLFVVGDIVYDVERLDFNTISRRMQDSVSEGDRNWEFWEWSIANRDWRIGKIQLSPPFFLLQERPLGVSLQKK
jgi:hypothetical protein